MSIRLTSTPNHGSFTLDEVNTVTEVITFADTLTIYTTFAGVIVFGDDAAGLEDGGPLGEVVGVPLASGKNTFSCMKSKGPRSEMSWFIARTWGDAQSSAPAIVVVAESVK